MVSFLRDELKLKYIFFLKKIAAKLINYTLICANLCNIIKNLHIHSVKSHHLWSNTKRISLVVSFTARCLAVITSHTGITEFTIFFLASNFTSTRQIAHADEIFTILEYAIVVRATREAWMAITFSFTYWASYVMKIIFQDEWSEKKKKKILTNLINFNFRKCLLSMTGIQAKLSTRLVIILMIKVEKMVFMVI